MTEHSPSPSTTPQADTAACTIVSPNYLAYARTLAVSYLRHHPDHRFFVLIIADLSDPTPFASEPFEAVMLPSIGWADLADLSAAAMKYDILELNTNVKPTFLKNLFAQGFERIIFLDPDIYVYAPLTPVLDALSSHDAVLTPHLTTPVFDGKKPSEQDMLYNGTYNLGFYATRNTPNSIAILDWWERRCLDVGFSEGRSGLFVDQKWMNLVPGLFENIAILRHPGCNMAYWNLNDRTLSGSAEAPIVNHEFPLCFFHFSGIVATDPANLSRNCDRFTLATRPDLQPVFAAYKAALLANKGGTNEALPYGCNVFSNGTAVTLLARRLYAAHEAHFRQIDANRHRDHDPFDANGPFFEFCERTGLLDGSSPPPKSTWSSFSAKDPRVTAVHILLRLTLRILGPNRYELLMRYLAHITVLRNQSAIFHPD